MKTDANGATLVVPLANGGRFLSGALEPACESGPDALSVQRSVASAAGREHEKECPYFHRVFRAAAEEVCHENSLPPLLWIGRPQEHHHSVRTNHRRAGARAGSQESVRHVLEGAAASEAVAVCLQSGSRG